MTYANEDISKMIVRISDDFEQAVLLNKTENYLLEKNDMTAEKYQ